MLSATNYAQNYAGIIGKALLRDLCLEVLGLLQCLVTSLSLNTSKGIIHAIY